MISSIIIVFIISILINLNNYQVIKNFKINIQADFRVEQSYYAWIQLTVQTM